MSLLEINDLYSGYGKVEVLFGISFKIEPGKSLEPNGRVIQFFCCSTQKPNQSYSRRLIYMPGNTALKKSKYEIDVDYNPITNGTI